MKKSREDVEKGAEEILALLRGEAGPFLDNGNSYFGVKQVDSSMKDNLMETDCGGMLITRSKMTYGEADEIARRVDLTEYPAFLSQIKPSCYWKVNSDGRVFYGDVFWSIYSYLATMGYIPGDPAGYNNTMEHLFAEVLKRLVAAGVFHTSDNRWFTSPHIDKDKPNG